MKRSSLIQKWRLVDLLDRLFGRPAPRRAHPHRRTLETLEDRLAPAAAPIQFFYVPMPEQQTRAALAAIGSGTTGNDETSLVTITATENNTVLYYDQWEDGYETNLNAPIQASTQIWGDGNAANGMPPGFATDVINAGTIIRLRNDVPANPRDPANLFYDGGDKFGATKTVALSRAQFPVTPGSVIASAVEVRDTRFYDTSFHAPVGTNTANAGQMFEYAAFFVQAAEDNTTVQVDLDGNGSFDQTVTLNQGQTLATAGTVRQGGRVVASKPVQVQLLTGDIGSNYASRSYTLFSDTQLANDYFTPVGLVSGGAPVNLFVYNPSATTAITVNYQTQTTSGSLGSVAAGATARF
ncbi:MAG: hypothetical protein U0736_27810, partial [Gemmataceae bacterium]